MAPKQKAVFQWKSIEALHEFFRGTLPTETQLSLLSHKVLKENIRMVHFTVKNIDRLKVGELADVIRQHWQKYEIQRDKCAAGHVMIGEYVSLDGDDEAPEQTVLVYVKTLNEEMIPLTLRSHDVISIKDYIPEATKQQPKHSINQPIKQQTNRPRPRPTPRTSPRSLSNRSSRFNTNTQSTNNQPTNKQNRPVTARRRSSSRSS